MIHPYGKKLALDCGLDIEKVRSDFPIFGDLKNKQIGKKFIYLDNAATTHKPHCVIDSIKDFDSQSYATVRRGGYRLGELATQTYEAARKTVAQYLGVSDARQIIITSGTTQSINLVASSYGKTFLKAGDQIIISVMEHHANIIPWQVLCEEQGILLKVLPISDQGELDLQAYEALLSKKNKISVFGIRIQCFRNGESLKANHRPCPRLWS